MDLFVVTIELRFYDLTTISRVIFYAMNECEIVYRLNQNLLDNSKVISLSLQPASSFVRFNFCDFFYKIPKIW